MKSILFALFGVLFLSMTPIKQLPLTITISNIKSIKGNIRVGIYKVNNQFPNEKDTYKNKIYKITKTSSMLIKIEDLPYGEYAIGIYQDENKNGKLDKSFIGAPKEPFAFSNNFKPLFSAPDFNDCKFNYSNKHRKLNLKMLNY